MEHPRIRRLHLSQHQPSLPPVVQQLLGLLKSFIDSEDPLPLGKIKSDIRENIDLPIHLCNRQQTLLRFYYTQLFRRVLGFRSEGKQKLSCLKVCIATGIQAGVDLTIDDFYLTITQMSQIMISIQNCQYLPVINYIITSQQEYYKYSLHLFNLPSLIQLLKNISPQHQLPASQILLTLITSPDPYISQINKIVILKSIKWVSTLFSSILKCSNLVLTSLMNDGFCMDPFDIEPIWSDAINGLEDYERTRDIVFRQGLQEMEFPNVVRLHRELGLTVGVKEMQEFDFRNYKIMKGKDSKMVADIWCQFAKSQRFYESFQYQSPTTVDKEGSGQNTKNVDVDEIINNSDYLIDLIFFVMDTHLDASKPHNYFWLKPIHSLLELGYNSKKQSLFKSFCELLITNDIVYLLFQIVKVQSVTSLTIHTLESISDILALLWAGCSEKMCTSVKESFSLKSPENKVIFDSMRHYMTGYLTHALVYYRIYTQNYEKIRKQFTLESRDLISAASSVFEKGILSNPSQLFIATTFFTSKIQATSLLIAILLVSDINQVFNDWLKYQYKEQLINKENISSPLVVDKFDPSVGNQIREWLLHHDAQDRAQIQRTFKMPYSHLRLRVSSLLQIFTNDEPNRSREQCLD